MLIPRKDKSVDHRLLPIPGSLISIELYWNHLGQKGYRTCEGPFKDMSAQERHHLAPRWGMVWSHHWLALCFWMSDFVSITPVISHSCWKLPCFMEKSLFLWSFPIAKLVITIHYQRVLGSIITYNHQPTEVWQPLHLNGAYPRSCSILLYPYPQCGLWW